MQLQILNNVTAANGAPSAATAGFPLFKSSQDMQYIDPQRDGLYDGIDELEFLLKGAVTGAGSLSYLRIWGFFRVTDAGVDASFWAPLGTGTDADKGKLNAGAAVGGTTTIVHAERLRGVKDLTRIYLEVGVVTGTVTTLDAWLSSRGQVN